MNIVKKEIIFFRNVKSSQSAPIFCLYYFDGMKIPKLFGKSSFIAKNIFHCRNNFLHVELLPARSGTMFSSLLCSLILKILKDPFCCHEFA